MKKFRLWMKYFTLGEWILWGSSVVLTLLSYFLLKQSDFLSTAASVLGATALIFCAKGNPIGQVLMILFCCFYGYISWTFAYYGEMLTYLGMSGPMAVFALVSWVKNPHNGNKAEVKVNRIGGREVLLMLVLSAVVTGVFYFILKYLNTANLLPSTISVTTSFIAVYLTYRRSPYYALAYAANDIVLIVLWALATVKDLSYLSVILCFVMFLVNDLYGFYNWMKMQRRQQMGDFGRTYGEDVEE